MEQQALETRVLILEKEMEWTRSGMESLKTDLLELKAGQNRLLENLSDWRAETNEKIIHSEERISSLQAHMDERISHLQARMDSQMIEVHHEIGSLWSHTDARFIEVHQEIGALSSRTEAQFVEVHRELAGLHGAIAIQTRWILAALLGAATMVSLGLPVVFQLAKRFL